MLTWTMPSIQRVNSLPIWVKPISLLCIITITVLFLSVIPSLFEKGITKEEAAFDLINMEEDSSDLMNMNEASSHLLNQVEDEILLVGNFVAMDSVHKGSGLVNIVKQENGDLKLLFIDVNIADGPGLVIYLSKKSSFTGIYDDPGDYIDLGDLPKTTGNFSVSIPNTTIIDQYHSVMIWCDPFDVVFTFASLQSRNTSTTSPTQNTEVTTTIMTSTNSQPDNNQNDTDSSVNSPSVFLLILGLSMIAIIKKKRKS
ncbi:MAG: DM13 domain-containing protein [Candidatus Kariarchaeaceae archaeon]|jgi:hypothetical protein